MTLCIAAACQERGNGRLVIATDWKVTTGSATAEIQDKLDWISDAVPVMIAGDISRAMELIDTYKAYFRRLKAKNKSEIYPEDSFDTLKRPVGIHKQKLANELTSLKFGLTYKQFREAVGKNEIPTEVATETFNEIGRIDFKCSLIIAMFTRKDPNIFKVDEFGTLCRCDNFATIGSGSAIAEGVLYQREQEAKMPIGRTAYHVFEAMKLGSIASDVGKEHTLNVLSPPPKGTTDVEISDISDKGKVFLERQFKRLGPKEFSNMKIPDGFLD